MIKRVNMINIINKNICKIIFLLVVTIGIVSILNFDVKASYVESEQELRAVWVTPVGGDADLYKYSSEEKFKSNMNYILDTLEMYNMNAIVFHVRTYNNAFYKSSLNPLSSYWSDVDFDTFDPLEWFIDECHKRGIEFHAWLNPYRVASSGTLEEVASDYKDYPNNPASDVNNLLKGESSIILNPGLQNVRDFICDSVMELIENYDIDAIHFDDYFYCNMGAGGKTTGDYTIINEADQVTYEAYVNGKVNCQYDSSSATDKADWRREQVNLFIKQLHEEMTEYNENNNRYVQLGIAPTGIYKNGDGKVSYDSTGNSITTGSNTGGQTHYSSYLYCDTVNWINNGWIDYIMPQTYWSFGLSIAKYNEVIGWWNQVVKYKNVNLYSGVGLYMSDSSGNTYSWQTDEFELKNQIEYMTTLENVDGACIYNFKTLRKHRDGKTATSVTQVKNALEENCWQNKVPCAEIKSFKQIVLGQVNNFNVEKGSKNVVSFEKLDGAKFYCIYRSDKELTYSSSEIVDIFGSNENIITWEDEVSGNYNYGVKVLSYSNTLGLATDESNTLEVKNATYTSYDDVVNELLADYNKDMNQNKTIDDFKEMAKTSKTGYGMFTGNSNSFFSKISNMNKWSWLLYYLKDNRKNNGLDYKQYEILINTCSIDADAATINMELIAFLAGYKSYEYSIYKTCDYSTSSRDEYKEYSPYIINKEKAYIVTFVDYDDKVIAKQKVLENDSAIAPTTMVREGYIFTGWDNSFTNVTSNLKVKATYKSGEAKSYTVTFKDYDGSIIDTQTVLENNGAVLPANPVREGYLFEKWDQDVSTITSDLIVKAVYKLNKSYIDIQTIGCYIDGYSDGCVPYGTIITIKKTDNGIFKINGESYCFNDTFTFTVYNEVTIEVVDINLQKKSDIIYMITDEEVIAQAFTYGKGSIKEMGIIYNKDGLNPLYNSALKVRGELNNFNESIINISDIENAYIYCIININGFDTCIYKAIKK